MEWRFTVADLDPWQWRGSVGAVPVEQNESAFIQVAVPQLALVNAAVPSGARVVVGQVTALAGNGEPGGPVGRAKGLLDALHDNPKSGPFYCNSPP